MVTMTVQELVCMIICLLLLGMILGMLLALLLWQVTLPGKICAQKKTRRRLVYMVGDVRRTIGALQQLQALIGREVAEGDPGLGDIVHFIRSMQRLFGKKASLEGVIQVLVAQDIERQMGQQKQKSSLGAEKAAPVAQEVMMA